MKCLFVSPVCRREHFRTWVRDTKWVRIKLLSRYVDRFVAETRKQTKRKQSLFTVLAFPRKYNQAVWLRCTRPPAAGPLRESCPAHQNCPWICPLCGTAPGRPRAYAVCRTAGTSSQTAVGEQQKGLWNQKSKQELETWPYQTSFKLACFPFLL